MGQSIPDLGIRTGCRRTLGSPMRHGATRDAPNVDVIHGDGFRDEVVQKTTDHLLVDVEASVFLDGKTSVPFFGCNLIHQNEKNALA